MERIRILGIAPYQNLAILMQQAAEKRSDIDLTVYSGDLEEGALIASRYSTNDYDFIISRGGTAELIRKSSRIPVVEIEVSTCDLLRSIQIAENASRKFALIGFPGITKNAAFLKSLYHYHMDVFTIHSQEEAELLLQSLDRREYDTILSDSISNSLAEAFQFHSISITSGLEEVEETLNQVVFYGSIFKRSFWENKLYRALLNTHPFDIYVFSPDQKLIYHSREDVYSKELTGIMSAMIPTVLTEGKKKIYRKYSGLLAAISGSKKKIGDETIVQFYVNMRKTPLSLFKNGLHYKSREEILGNPDNLYLNFVPRQFLDELLKKPLSTKAPLLILAEHGMARDDFAEAFYLQSCERSNPLTLIDCSRLANDKNWAFLMQDMNSPLSDTETTIYIKNIDILPEQKFREFLSSINDTKLHLRNRIIFEMMHCMDTPYAERSIVIQNRFNCTCIEIPPLRRSREQIPQMSSLMIHAFNVEFGREIIGFLPEALLLLQDFEWPYNYTQLRRVVTKLGQLTDSPFIGPESVQKILHSEAIACSDMPVLRGKESKKAFSVSLDKDLNSITRDIIEAVLHEEEGNQSSAARRLGISRTTLWRMLK